MKKYLLGGLLGAAIIASTPVTFAETKAAGSGPNPFVDCGIGAALFPETHWAAVSSNVIWDIGTTALTSATASPETCSGKTVEAAQFILETYDNLAEESAKGNGEHLTAVLNIMECGASSHAPTTQAIRENVSNLIGESNYNSLSTTDKANSMFQIINTAVNNNCAV